MDEQERITEELRSKLLRNTYAGAFSGFPAMILDTDRIKRASYEELLQIAKEQGY